MDSEENSPWQYKPDGDNASKDADSPDSSESVGAKKSTAKSISWKAPEYIDHPRGVGWYLMLTLVTAALAALVYLVAKDKIATGTIVIVGIIVGIFASHKPGQAEYEITDSGLSINGKLYSYSDFKSFSVVHEGVLSSVNLLPLKRFMPPVSAYFEPGDEGKITNVIGNYLPYDNRKLDVIERLSRRLHL